MMERMATNLCFPGLAVLPSFMDVLQMFGGMTHRLMTDAQAAADAIAGVRQQGGADPMAELMVEFFATQRSWQFECLDQMLSLWSRLVRDVIADPSAGTTLATAWSTFAASDAHMNEARSALQEAVWVVYESFVQYQLHMAAAVMRAGDDDDNPFEDKSVLDEQMVNLALLGRVVPGRSTRLLCAALSERSEHLQRLIGSRGGDAAAGITGDTLDTELAVVNEVWRLQWAALLLTASHYIVQQSPILRMLGGTITPQYEFLPSDLIHR